MINAIIKNDKSEIKELLLQEAHKIKFVIKLPI